MFGGDAGVEICRNLVMCYSSGDTQYVGLYLTGVSNSINVHNNVLLNIYLNSGWTGQVVDNYFAVGFSGSNNLNSGGTVSGNQQAAVSSQFTTLSSDMSAKLGSGQLGCFRTV
jgi:hypothetical protein